MKNSLINKVSSKVAPSWTLERMVAVNPFHGFADEPMTQVAKRFKQITDANLFSDRANYRELFLNKIFEEDHINLALKRNNKLNLNVSEVVLDLFQKTTENPSNAKVTITSNCTKFYKADLIEFKIDFFSNWLSHLTQNNQNLAAINLVEHFHNYARINLSAQLFGIKGFHKTLASFPITNYKNLLDEYFQLDQEQEEIYLFGLVYTLPGWASYLRGLDWDNQLQGKDSQILEQFMYALLIWEYILLEGHRQNGVKEQWLAQLKQDNWHENDREIQVLAILQTAVEIAHAERLEKKLKFYENPLFQIVEQID